jgi:hypothetical protein
MLVPEVVRFATEDLEFFAVAEPFKLRGFDATVALWRGGSPGKPQAVIIPAPLPATGQLYW